MTAYRGQNNAVFYFQVTGNSYSGVYGTDIYTDDSGLASVAVHAGVIGVGETAIVKVTILPGQSSYTGSVRNGVSSSSWGSWQGSYSVEDAEAGSSVDFAITQQPTSVAGNEGNSVSLSVQVDGSGQTFQWYRGESGDDSDAVSGATSNTLSVTIGAVAQSYWVRATNASGSVDSDAAVVSPYITGNPSEWIDITVNVPGDISDSVIGPMLADGSTIYLLGATGIYRSDNNGDSFAFANDVSGQSYDLDLAALRFVEKANNFIYVGTATDSVTGNNGYTPLHRIQNGQSSWSQASQLNLPDSVISDSVEDIAYDATTGTYIASSIYAGSYISTDGVTWQASNNGLPAMSLPGVGTFFHGDTVAARNGKLFLSILAGAQSGVYESSDSGSSWSYSGVPASSVGELAQINNTIAISTSGAITTDAGVYTSTDNGETWRQNEGPSSGLGTDIRSNGNHLFAASGSNFKFSASEGLTWQDLDTTGLPGSVNAYWLEPNGTHLFALANVDGQNRLYRRPLNSLDLSLETRMVDDPSKQFSSLFANVGLSLNVSAYAVGPNINYQWTFNGEPVPGATLPDLSFFPTESGNLNLTVTGDDRNVELENSINIQVIPSGPGNQDVSFRQTVNPIRGVAVMAPGSRVVQIEAPRMHVFDRNGATLATRTGAGDSRIRNGFIDSQGRLMGWGEFTLARYDLDTLANDPAFTPVVFESTTIRINGAAELPGVGYILALASGTELDGVPMPPIALFDYAGNFVSDLGFGIKNSSTNFPPVGNKIVAAPGGKVYISVSGRFPNDEFVNWRRLNSDGTLDNTFAHETFRETLLSDTIDHIAADGTIYYRSVSGNREVRRLLPDGTRDLSFNVAGTQFEDDVYGMVTDSQGRVYVYGEFEAYGSNQAMGHVRLNPDGTFDPTYDASDGFAFRNFGVVNHHPIGFGVIDPEGGIYYISSETNSSFRETRQTGLVRVFTDNSTEPDAFDAFVASLPAGQRSPSDDPDLDSISNLLEFLYGLNPAQSDLLNLTEPAVLQTGTSLNTQYPSSGFEPGETYPTFQILWPVDLLGSTLNIEVATNLQNWGSVDANPILLETSPVSATLERRTYALDKPQSQLPTVFLRLNASR
ncbi:LCCL domain-containing protein [Cerasicoccus fimbriatus]|uniref:LCCL domain-containing protein n=1 Tax=Cerasicoccus fimbriatus TaxID=3014554 RepID=UPI0022B4DC5C|nr:LCCL domain-containing protein [Cerasicoccus sp. TK19100]